MTSRSDRSRPRSHPLGYADFAGTIPNGEYAAATVVIWDRGRYPPNAGRPDKIKVTLFGERGQGRHVFFATRRWRSEGETTGPGDARADQSWMVHRMDPPTDPDREPIPTRLAPMLAVAGPAPHGADWAFEIKWDGVRALAFVDGGQVTLRSRSGRDITDAYPELRALGPALGSTQAILDGEIVAFGADGTPDFGLLSHRMHIGSPSAARRAASLVPVRYLVFDLLFLDGHAVTGRPYSERRRLLDALPGRGVLNISEEFAGTGGDILAASSAAGLEGVVAKRRTSTYQPGRRSGDWVKVKNIRRQSVLIGGWEPGTGRRTDRIGALLVGVATQRGPRYAGQVGTGFTEATLERLAALLAPLRREGPPFSDVPSDVARHAVWVDPTLIAEVDHGSWTAEGRLRHPSFKGLRDDLSPADTAREDPRATGDPGDGSGPGP